MEERKQAQVDTFYGFKTLEHHDQAMQSLIHAFEHESGREDHDPETVEYTLCPRVDMYYRRGFFVRVEREDPSGVSSAEFTFISDGQGENYVVELQEGERADCGFDIARCYRITESGMYDLMDLYDIAIEYAAFSN